MPVSGQVDSSGQSSYSQILRSSSIIGGAQGINYIVSLVRVKIVAILLGPGGVGLIGLFQSMLGVMGSVSGLGIRSSGVREVAHAAGHEDPEKIARTVKVLRRACWVTGLAGWALTALLAKPISRLVLGSDVHALAIAVLGGTLLLTAVSGGQMALIQGIRRIGDLARINVIAMLINTVVTIGLYAWLGQAGIVPVLLANAAISLGVSWWFARRVEVQPAAMTWRETLAGTRGLATLGFAFMWSGLLSMAVDLATRTIVIREFGIEAAGYYQAAWALSGLFAGFVLGAMGADFYPRLTGLIEDRPAAIRAVNEQTEIGVLLALPGLLATMALAPLVIRIFYSAEFAAAAQLLPWFLLGVFGRVISWPLGFIQLAKGQGRWFMATETLFLAAQLSLVLLFVARYGLVGVSYAFAATYVLYVIGVLWVAARLIGFSWSREVRRLLMLAGSLVLAAVVTRLMLEGWWAAAVGALVAGVGAVFCLRGLAECLGSDHRLIRLCMRFPGMRFVLLGQAL